MLCIIFQKKREQQLRELHGTCQVGSLTLSQLLGRARVLGGGYNLALQPPREIDEFEETAAINAI